MASSFPHTLLCFLVLLLPLFSSSSDSSTDPHRLHMSSLAFSPKLQADLNLFPKDETRAHYDSLLDAPKFFEKRVLMPYLAVNGTTITELGHHTGYYRLPHSHAARMF